MIYFWLIHFILTGGYLLAFKEKHRQHFYSELLILLFLPIAGFVLLIYSRWIRRKINRFGQDKDKVEELNFILEEIKNTETISAPVKYDNNVVSLNDVLYLDDVEDKRKLLTTAIRQAALDDSSILRRAIRDADRDVAHYAVSVATNNLSIMEKQNHLMESQWEEKCKDIGYLKDYAKLLQSYITLDVSEDYTLDKLKDRYKDVLLRILIIEENNDYYLELLVNLLLSSEDFEKAESMIMHFILKHSEQEEGYILLLKLYVMQKRHADIVKLLSQLKSSKVHFSAEGMKLMRFWSLGVNNEQAA